MTYAVHYDNLGYPIAIQNGSMFIPLGNELAPDFVEFRNWNAQQTIPLDYTSRNLDGITWMMSRDKEFIFGGDDVATITFRGTPNGTAEFTVNGVACTVALDATGNGSTALDGDLPRGSVSIVGTGKLAGQTLKLFVV